ncbi:UNVERIFIED_CONTAM: hypothetical protein ABIC26_000294 [Paenibacillus sp. PvR008]
MKSKLLKFLSMVLLVSTLVSINLPLTYADSVQSAPVKSTVYGTTYVYRSVLSIGGGASAWTLVTTNSGDPVPMGYMGVQGRLYNSENSLIRSTDWKYTTKSTSGIQVQTDYLSASGNYYSYGAVDLYNGNGYTRSYAYKTSIGTQSIGGSSYDVNENGETYGSGVMAAKTGVDPDLIASVGIDGTSGYVRSEDLNSNHASTPEEALKIQQEIGEQVSKIIPLYDKDGKTIVGKFVIDAGEVEQGTIEK